MTVPVPTSPRGTTRPPLRHDIAEGLRYLFGHPLLRPMAIVLGLMNLLGTMTIATFVLLARDRLGLSDAGYGFLLISGAAGGLLATPFAPRIIRRVGEGTVMVASLWLMAAIPLIVPLTHSPVVVGVYFALEAGVGITWNVATVSLRQRIIPDRLFGRVNSVYRLLAWGTMPIGAAIGGVVAEQYGLVAPYWISVVVMGVASLWFSFRLGNRHVEAAKQATSRVVTSSAISDERGEEGREDAGGRAPHGLVGELVEVDVEILLRTCPSAPRGRRRRPAAPTAAPRTRAPPRADRASAPDAPRGSRRTA